MAKPKQKGSMRPAGFTRWKRARTAYHLTAAEVAMAKATGFNPTVMEAAAANRTKPRRAGEKLATRSKPGQVKKVKQLIRSRYEERFGEVLKEAPTIEELRAEQSRKRSERRAQKRAEAGAVPPPEPTE